ncbi:MAG: hypothetical protein RL497_851 [Pseudomonadota bacterium]|jgi:tetratricopeptide (TPR) repeat protein
MALLNKISILISLLILAGCASTESNINSGLWHYEAGLYGEAIPRLVRPITSFEKRFPHDERVSRSYLALGVMAENSKAYDKAEEYLIKSVESAKTSRPLQENTLRNAESMLGNFYLNRKKYSEALTHLNTAESISSKFKEKSILNSIDLDNISTALQGAGKLKESIEFSERALKVAEKTPEDNSYNLTKGIILFNLAKSNEENGNNTKAKELYDKAIELLTISSKENTSEQWRLDAALKAARKL